jgi:hypothetical protein
MFNLKLVILQELDFIPCTVTQRPLQALDQQRSQRVVSPTEVAPAQYQDCRAGNGQGSRTASAGAGRVIPSSGDF